MHLNIYLGVVEKVAIESTKSCWKVLKVVMREKKNKAFNRKTLRAVVQRISNNWNMKEKL